MLFSHPIDRNVLHDSQLLEINRLALNHELVRLPAVGRNSYLYLGREKATAGAKAVKGGGPQVLFLRSISLSPETVSAQGSEKSLTLALDELERAVLDPRVRYRSLR